MKCRICKEIYKDELSIFIESNKDALKKIRVKISDNEYSNQYDFLFTLLRNVSSIDKKELVKIYQAEKAKLEELLPKRKPPPMPRGVLKRGPLPRPKAIPPFSLD